MEFRETPFLSEEEWREKKRKREVPSTVPSALYWAVDELLAQQREPQLMARGCEHLVIRLKKNGAVVKVNYAASLPTYLALMSNEPKDLDRALASMERERVRYLERIRRLDEYFGIQAVPRQSVIIAEVPVSARVANLLVSDLEVPEEGGPRSMPAWLTVQREVKLDPENTVSLVGYYLEDAVMASGEPEDLERYDKVHDILSRPAAKDTGMLEQQKNEVIKMFDDLGKISTRLEKDPEFKSVLRDAVRKMVRYSSETGEVLDLAGLDNAVMVRDDSGWKLKLPDALSAAECRYDVLEEAAEILAKGGELDGQLAVDAHYAMNTYRVINGLALLADLQERFDLPAIRKVSAEKWLGALSEGIQ